MRFIHYDKSTLRFIGFYNDEVHRKVPTPADEITLEGIEGKGQKTHYDPKTKRFFELDQDVKERASEEMVGWLEDELKSTDKYLLSDYPISAHNLASIKEYRSGLRDDLKGKNTPHLWRKPVRPF